jgi:hypothetical protein
MLIVVVVFVEVMVLMVGGRCGGYIGVGVG